MLKLYGFASSNYYSKVKLVMLEKDVAFEEVLVWPRQKLDYLDKSPLGKIPFLESEHGSLCESQVMAEYINTTYPGVKLMPADPFAAAKVRELTTFLEWHVEIVIRELLPAAFFGATATEECKERVKAALSKNIAGLGRLIKCSPFLAGGEMSLADCAAAVHIPFISSISKIMFNEDVLDALPLAAYKEMLFARPAVQKVHADTRANMPLLMEQIAQMRAAAK